MNNDRISNTPGGERMLLGGITLVLSVFAYAGLQYELGTIGKAVTFAVMAFGAVQLARGLVEWKRTDPREFRENKPLENLFVDVPLEGHGMQALHRIEDALIELIRNSRSVSIELHSIDTANKVGVIHLTGRNADAMFAHVYSTLAPFAKMGGLNLFPPQGQAIDTELHGKRVMLIVQDRSIH